MTKEETLLAAFKECGLPIEIAAGLSSPMFRAYWLLGGAGAYIVFRVADGEVEDYHPGYE